MTEKKRLVVIDDEPDMGQYVVDVAEMNGYLATAYTSVREFFQPHVPADYDVVVLDLKMPEIDGIELLRMFAHHRITQPLILISGVDETILHSARELTAELQLNLLDSLQKPFLPQELAALLKRVTRNSAPSQRPSRPRLFQVDELRDAIADGRIIPYLQPQIRVSDRQVIGFEALARWDHPEHGIVLPGDFIPLAERNGLIERLTWQMVDQIAETWRVAKRHQNVSINMPAQLYNDLELPERLFGMLERCGMAAGRLTLEVTETALIGELTRSLDTLTRLRMMGFHLSIDDYGTGYSSLVQLYRAPFSELKIDRSFVMKMQNDAEAMAIVEATLLLGHKLNMTVVAEGVEGENELQRLAELECDIAQGFHIARPMPLEAVDDWMATWQRGLSH